MKLGVFTTFMQEYTFAEACKAIKSVGFDGVQPRIVPAQSASFDPTKPFNPWGNNKGGISEDDFFADPKGVLKPATDLGLEISSVASYTNTADLKRAVNMVKACAKAGIKNVRIGAPPMPKEKVFDMNAFVETSQATYKELVQEAKKVKVRPCLELHMGTAWPSPAGVVNFLRPFSPDEVGVLYDPANMIVDGWETPVVALNVLGAYLAEVHVKNSLWVPDGQDERGYKKWKYASANLEEGLVNWGDVIDLLKAHKYNGWLVEEGHAPDRDSFTRIKLAYELLRKLTK